MTSFKKNNRGFTIVELLIVIVVIGILAALVIVTYNGIQQKARDTERKTDINALASHLEAYNASAGRYPTLVNVNDTAFRAANMKGLPGDALQILKAPRRHWLIHQRPIAMPTYQAPLGVTTLLAATVYRTF